METIQAQQQVDRLTQRRDQITKTLHYINKEQSQVERNTEWLDQAAHDSRVQLLDRLSRWYKSEIEEIEKALERIADRSYGTCAACHREIDRARIESVPEAAYCSDCQAFRESISAN